MESAQNLKRRIKSVTNIGTITKAMELVAATKMRRAQELALASRPYAYTALELLGILSQLPAVQGAAEAAADGASKKMELPEILRPRVIEKGAEKTAFFLVTSDKGLAGSFNSAVIRKFENFLKNEKDAVTGAPIDLHAVTPSGPKYSFIAIGQKAKTYLERRGLNVIASFNRVGDFMKPEEAEPIADFLVAQYAAGAFDRVRAFYTLFVTALRQDAVVRDFLPVDYDLIKQSIEDTIPRAGRYSQYAQSESFFESKNPEYIIEPSPAEVLKKLAPQLLKTRVYHMILEANASEHSARRVAMKSASDNAGELSENLNVEYNKSRQAGITRELTEITAGAEALK